eukprot:scaffold627_cov125-Cylindrotheca_fusiformis.AAC.27
MSSSWGKKFEKKLAALADSASKESIQTLANWVGFNRKHASIITQTLTNELKANANNESRQWLYWQLIHEILLLDKANPAKWGKLQELRTALGESTIVTGIETITKLSPQVQESLVKEWDEHNVFGGPTLVAQIRRLLSSTSSGEGEGDEESKPAIAKEVAAAAAEEAKDRLTKENEPSQVSTEVTQEIEEKEADPEKESATVERRSSLSSLSGKDIDYDFESKGVPAGKVDSKQFLEPCKAIATLQIARDLRNDAPVQLSSLLDNLPPDIQENLDSEEFSEETIDDYGKRIPAKLLDMNLDEQLGNIATFKDILLRQQTARKTLIHLLLKSRCQFGSSEAAKLFFELEDTSQKLKKRKQLLADALELEGLDNEIDSTDITSSIAKLPKLSWYQKEDAGDSTSNKKTRIE